MEKLSIIILKFVLALSCAIGTACLLIIDEWNDKTVWAAYFFVCIMVCLKLGLFDVKDDKPKKHLSIKRGARSMRQAA